MKVFQVEDVHAEIVEYVLSTLSRRNAEIKLDNIVFCIVYEDQRYHVGYYNASPANMITASGYISMDANMRYMKVNREEFENDDEHDEGS